MRGAATKKAATAAALLSLTLAAAALGKTYIQKDNVRIAFGGHVVPGKLPRTGSAPVTVSLSADISTIDNTEPPQLRRIKLEINRNGHLDLRGLPTCRFRLIQPATTAQARQACSSALVGHGGFRANVELPEQSPFPSNGDILAFNGRMGGKPVILAHIYGTLPLPTSFTLPFRIGHRRDGTYDITLNADLPDVAAEWGFVRGISLTLGRRFRAHGVWRSYISAGCPAAPGFPGATFNLARTAFDFDGGTKLKSVIVRDCRAR